MNAPEAVAATESCSAVAGTDPLTLAVAVFIGIPFAIFALAELIERCQPEETYSLRPEPPPAITEDRD